MKTPDNNKFILDDNIDTISTMSLRVHFAPVSYTRYMQAYALSVLKQDTRAPRHLARASCGCHGRSGTQIHKVQQETEYISNLSANTKKADFSQIFQSVLNRFTSTGRQI